MTYTQYKTVDSKLVRKIDLVFFIVLLWVHNIGIYYIMRTQIEEFFSHTRPQLQ